MTTHTVKCWPEHFAPLLSGEKTAELRLNDRAYAVGDLLINAEWEPMTRTYSGRETCHRITHIVSDGPWLVAGYVLLSLAPWRERVTMEEALNTLHAAVWWPL
jgi:hypothetical protein